MNATEKAKSDEICELAKRVQSGDVASVPLLITAMKQAPWLVELAGNLVTKVRDTVVAKMAGENHLFKQGVLAKLDELQKELGGSSSTALERLLIDRIVICWLTLYDAELRHATDKEKSWKQDFAWQTHIALCHKMYLTSIRMLATVRKLALRARIGQECDTPDAGIRPELARHLNGHASKTNTVPT